VIINVKALTESKSLEEFGSFFSGASNFFNSLLVIVMVVYMSLFIPYSFYMIISKYEEVTLGKIEPNM